MEPRPNIETTMVRQDGTEEPLPVRIVGDKVFAASEQAWGLRIWNTSREDVYVRVRATKRG
jgi:hypothetical protein